MNEKNQIKYALESIDLFSHFRGNAIEAIFDQSQILLMPKGKILFVHEEPAQRFYIIQSGHVKLFRETLDGTQAVIDILNHGHMFGETSIFQNNTYAYSAEVIEQSSIVSLPLSVLKSEIEDNPKIAVEMLSAMANYRQKQDKELEHIIIQNAPQRIGCFLLRLADQENKGHITINLPYDKTLVAARLGMQPETFSRALGKLKENTGIRIKGSTIEIDSLKQLEEFTCIACSSNFPCKDLKEEIPSCLNRKSDNC